MKKSWRLKSFIPVFVSFCAAALLMSCASSGEQYVSPQSQRELRNQVDSLNLQMDALQESNQEIRSMLSGSEGAKFDLNSQRAVADKLTELENRVSMLENHMEFADSTRFDLVTRVKALEQRLDQGGVPQASGAMTTSSKHGKVSPEVYRQDYKHAYDLYSQKEYKQAIPAFSKVIEENPDGDLSDNAQYWIGECYYGLQDYTRAVVEFEKVFTFKDSNKDDDAQLKLGLCYLNLGQRDKAREEFQRLVDFYTDSEYKPLAIEYLKKLN